MHLFPALVDYISDLDSKTISKTRKEALQQLVKCLQEKVNQQVAIRLNFICTHNSRRSHFAQVWTQALAAYFGLEIVYSYSGGTETTAVFPMVLETLLITGFQVKPLTQGQNPIYSIKYGENEPPLIGFSKEWNHFFNPKNQFIAILTCAEADEACPTIFGAEKRISLPFVDPKIYDNTPLQVQKYGETSLQIATELFYVFAKIKTENDQI